MDYIKADANEPVDFVRVFGAEVCGRETVSPAGDAFMLSGRAF
jgi:hypothetical protein